MDSKIVVLLEGFGEKVKIEKEVETDKLISALQIVKEDVNKALTKIVELEKAGNMMDDEKSEGL